MNVKTNNKVMIYGDEYNKNKILKKLFTARFEAASENRKELIVVVVVRGKKRLWFGRVSFVLQLETRCVRSKRRNYSSAETELTEL